MGPVRLSSIHYILSIYNPYCAPSLVVKAMKNSCKYIYYIKDIHSNHYV